MKTWYVEHTQPNERVILDDRGIEVGRIFRKDGRRNWLYRSSTNGSVRNLRQRIFSRALYALNRNVKWMQEITWMQEVTKFYPIDIPRLNQPKETK